MTKLKYIFIIILLISGVNYAKKDSLELNFWAPDIKVGLNLSQISLNNWSKGGSNSLTWVLFTNSGLNYYTKNWTFRNKLDVSYGRTKIGGENFRTNDNEVFLENVLSKKIGWAVNPYISNTIRTSLTTGYSYDNDVPEKVADFFDPGYVTQGMGFTYDKLASFKTRFGFAVQETFTNKYRKYSDDTTTAKKEAFKVETGLESVTNMDLKIVENIYAKSSLRFFTRFESLNVWDVRWDNSIIAKVNEFINVNFTFLLIYEKQESPKTQTKQTLQLGIVYSVI